MGRIAIYTCIIGAYDTFFQPWAECCSGPEFLGSASGITLTPQSDIGSFAIDFICFVGAGEKTAERIGAWEIRQLPQSALDACRRGSNAALLSRYPKTHPHELLPEYEASLWIDGNIAITGPQLYEALRAKTASGVLYAGVPHPTRDCVYSEARKCRDMRYISYFGLLRVWVWLALHGEKRHGGLMENNLIFRRHNNPAIVRLDELWWHYVRDFCRRDQLSFMWCLRRCGIEVTYLLGTGVNSRNFPALKYHLHR